MDKIQPSLRDSIADTSLLTLYARATEAQNIRPLLHDDLAIKLVEQLDYDFSIFQYAHTTAVGVALRSIHFDQITRDFIESHQEPIIVIIGCGLDTRKHRLGEVSDKAIFYQLDLPEVITLRTKLLPPEFNEHYIPCDMLKSNWKDQLLERHPEGDFLFIIEGVLMYLTGRENQQFFHRLAERFKGAEVHFDMFNDWMSQHTYLHEGVSKTKATFKFGLNDEKQIQNWHDDLRHEQTWLLSDNPDWYRMGFPFVSSYLMSYTIRTAIKFLKFTINKSAS